MDCECSVCGHLLNKTTRHFHCCLHYIQYIWSKSNYCFGMVNIIACIKWQWATIKKRRKNKSNTSNSQVNDTFRSKSQWLACDKVDGSEIRSKMKNEPKCWLQFVWHSCSFGRDFIIIRNEKGKSLKLNLNYEHGHPYECLTSCSRCINVWWKKGF